MPVTLIFSIVFAVMAGVIALIYHLTKPKATVESVEVDQPNDRDYGRSHSQSYYNPRRNTQELHRKWLFGGTWLCVAVAALLLLLSSFTIIGTKKVGVVTSFGKPVGTLSNGLHIKAPWTKTVEFDAAIQTDNHVNRSNAVGCTSVRIGNQSMACVDNSVRWRIVQDAADELFRDYRGFENVRDSLVTRKLNKALNDVLARYNPLGDLNGGTPSKDTLDTLSRQVESNLSAAIGKQVEILDVIVPIIRFDNTTQQKIDAYQAAVAETRIAIQRQKTAEAEAIANKRLAGSVSNDPNVLVSKCLDTLSEMVKQNQTVPAGFSCWPGSGLAGVIATSTSSNAKSK